MRLLALFTLATLAALALQTTFSRLLPIELFMPDLIVIFAVDLGLRHHGTLTGALMAFAMGYATDTFSGSQIGLNALMVTLIFLLANRVSSLLISSDTTTGTVMVFFAVIIHDLGDFVIGSGWSLPPHLANLLPQILLQAAITALLTPPVFAAVGWAAHQIGLRQSVARG